jgi:catechol 2,3-dioxygenase-like lactoylglutathione lyase family enzyme
VVYAADVAVDHLDLVVSSLERSLVFYRGLLAPLGYIREGEIAGERGERVIYLNTVESGGSMSLREAQSDDRGPYDRYGIGLHHLCFGCPSRAVVDERAEWLRSSGAEIESGPREYGYTPGYYAVFFYDPDGIKLELVHRPEERDLSNRPAIDR